jgi:hypothetical protein
MLDIIKTNPTVLEDEKIYVADCLHTLGSAWKTNYVTELTDHVPKIVEVKPVAWTRDMSGEKLEEQKRAVEKWTRLIVIIPYYTSLMI